MTKLRAGLLLLLLLPACTSDEPTQTSQGEAPAKTAVTDRAPELKAVSASLRPLAKELGKPKPGDWLASKDEPGQTFAQYLDCDPVTPRGKRRVLYVQPIGPFSPEQKRIVELGGEFMGLYFGVPTKILPTLPLSVVPKSAQRKHPSWGMHQLLSGYLLDEVLHPRLPEDAAALIGFTAIDLWPGRGWNFVFGYASLRKRVGVWSLARFGDPSQSPEAFKLCLLRTLKIGSHETGHMFSIRHCTAYECNMCGAMHQGESDRHPLALCPECLPKILWACDLEAKPRYEKLIAFATEHGLDEEAAAYRELLNALK